MKSFTDLEQSRKLADILPLESADMYYEEVCNLPKVIVGNYILHNQCMKDKDYKKLSNPVLSPAWSLAALLDIIKSKCEYYELVYLKSTFDRRGDRLENVHRFSVDIYDVYKEEPVDACYEMIIRLNELNLL